MWSIAGITVVRFGIKQEKYNVASLRIYSHVVQKHMVSMRVFAARVWIEFPGKSF